MSESDHVSGPLRLPDPSSPVVLWQNGVCRPAEDVSGTAILPGAFNPIHAGHTQLQQAAAEFLGCPVCFELSIENVDKPTLDRPEVARRLTHIATAPVLLTRAALFVDKARLFPGAWFVVGFDTAIRILDRRYYQRDREQRDHSLQQLKMTGTRFLVAGRVESASVTGDFLTGQQLDIDAAFREMFVELPEASFRVDISSTAIRTRQKPSPADQDSDWRSSNHDEL